MRLSKLEDIDCLIRGILSQVETDFSRDFGAAYVRVNKYHCDFERVPIVSR